MRSCQAVVVLLTMTASALAGEPESPPATPRVEEVMVVTASRTEQLVHDVPAAVSVVTSEDLERIPADGYGDILRTVPGVNVTQISAREIQVTARAATSSLATSQLVLLDGRSIYLDFFGFVMWDMLPINAEEIKQIEVVRGPGSAVWGANAMTGVVNMITRRPHEMQGTTVLLGGGEIGTVFASATHSGVRDRWSYKISAGDYRQDPFERPTGLIPGTRTAYPPFENEGTEQPKIDLRVDHELSNASYASVAAGYAGTDGLVHSGIGPFDIERGASMSYARAEWSRGALRAGAFANFLDVDSTNLLAVGVDGKPVSFSFRTRTYDVDVSSSHVVAKRHVLTAGATGRKNEFDLSIAPEGDRRDEYGAFLQDEMLLGKVRIIAGARWDHIDPIGAVLSPRTAILYSPSPNHTLRASFGRAFRAPSLINNYLDTAILNTVTLPGGPFVFATRAVGNRRLSEERLDAYEVGYVGTLPGRITLSASVYRNRTHDAIDFYAADFYTAGKPPRGWPLPPQALDAPPLRNALPSGFSYRNIGEITNQGVEIELSGQPAAHWSWHASASHQAEPEVAGIPAGEVNVPPSNRGSVVVSFRRGAWFGSAGLAYQDEAVWRDVLDARYWGPTESFTSINASAGVRWGEKATISILGSNLTNERIQQHVFGDIIARKITGQVRFAF